MAASALFLSSTYKVSVFPEINSVPSIYFSLKILLMERSSDSQSLEKIINQILGYINFCFEILAHLGHLFAKTRKIIKFNRWSCSKKWAKHNFKSYIYCVNHILPKKRHRTSSQECKQEQSLLFNFCNIFDFLTSRTQKIAWWSPGFESDFYIFFYNQQLKKIKDISSTSF